MGDDLIQLVRQQIPTTIWPSATPPPARTTPSDPADDARNLAAMVMGGRTGQVIELKFQYSASFSRDQKQESARISDAWRVFEIPDPNAPHEVNKDNFIDVDVPKQIAMTAGNGTETVYKYSPPPTPDNVELLQSNIKQSNPEYIPPTGGVSGGGGAPLRMSINRRAALPR